MAVAGAADGARGGGGSAWSRARVESGVGDPWLGFEVFGQDKEFAQKAQSAEFSDARHTAQARDLDREVRFVRRQFGGGQVEAFEPLLQVADVRVEIGGDQPVAIRGEGDGVEAGLLAGQFAAQLDETAADLREGQDRIGRRGPRHKLHALEELEDAEGIDGVGLGAAEPGALEVFDRPRIDDHHDHALGPVQGKRQAQAVNAGGFQTDASRGGAAGQQFRSTAGGRRGCWAGCAEIQGHRRAGARRPVQRRRHPGRRGPSGVVCSSVLRFGFSRSGSRPHAHVLDRPCLCRLASAATRRWPQILCGVDKESRGTDLTNRIAAGCNPRRALRRLRPPEGGLIIPHPSRLEHLAVLMNARYKATRHTPCD